jgi:hypothetical protein
MVVLFRASQHDTMSRLLHADHVHLQLVNSPSILLQQVRATSLCLLQPTCVYFSNHSSVLVHLEAGTRPFSQPWCRHSPTCF